ncbi:hypothetical protein Tco_1231531 [Tanacetum coccineum]
MLPTPLTFPSVECCPRKIPNAERGSIGDVGVGEDADEFSEGVKAVEEDDSGMMQFELAFTFSAALRLKQTCCQLCERSSSTKETVEAQGYEVDLENVRVGYTHGGQFSRSGGEQSAARLLTDHILIGHSSNAFDILCKQGTHMVISLLDPEANKVQQDGELVCTVAAIVLSRSPWHKQRGI